MSFSMQILFGLACFNVVFSFCSAIYRIATEKDECTSWKTSAVASLFSFLVYLAIVLGVWLGL